jgi:hypothetical protein
MAYDRYDSRDERSRWSGDRPRDRDWDRDRGRDRTDPEDRGFFERAGDEIASWFGDEDAERRRRDEHRMAGPPRHDRGPRPEHSARNEWDRERERGGYRPITGDYGRSRSDDPHYHSWRQRHIDELDRDYDDYRRENQSRFENDFGTWRERRMQKRGLLGQVREHMEVVGDDEQHVGTVDKVAGDRIILTRSDPDSGGTHHSLSCADIGRVEGDRVFLDCSAEQAKQRWLDESRSRALFERDDQGEMGPRMLDRSFQGTYRD